MKANVVDLAEKKNDTLQNRMENLKKQSAN